MMLYYPFDCIILRLILKFFVPSEQVLHGELEKTPWGCAEWGRCNSLSNASIPTGPGAPLASISPLLATTQG